MDEENTEVEPVVEAPDEVEEQSWQQSAGIENPRFNDFKSVGDLAKSYTELERLQTNHVRFPSEDAGEEDIAKFNSKMLDRGYHKAPTDPDAQRDILKLMGMPSEPQGYQFEEIDGFDSDPEAEGAFKAVAHEAGLTADQAKTIHNWLGSNIASDVQSATQRSEAGIAELKGEWGQAFDQKLHARS